MQLANDRKTPNLGAERRAAAENNTTTHWSTATQVVMVLSLCLA